MMHQNLLRRATSRPGANPVIRQFIETIAPRALLAYSHIPALGGSANVAMERDPLLPPEATSHSDRARVAFAQLRDQSLSAHLFNGIFAGARVAELLPPDRALREIDWQVWVLGFMMHDYTKAKDAPIEPRYLPQIRKIIEREGERLEFASFLPNWKDYLDDVTFLAQNTQRRRDANLDWSLYPDLRLAERRLFTLRDLAAFSDVLVHIHHPADVAERDDEGRDRSQNLRATLGMLFGVGRAPRLAYHQLTEVRGLLSNLINNALMRALEQHGHQPYLFFPDGVVYLVPDGGTAQLDTDRLIESLWTEVGAALAGSSGSDSDADQEDAETEEIEGGMRVSRTKDYMKVPPVLYELLSPQTLLLAGRQAALRIRNAVAAERLGAELCAEEGVRTEGLPLKAKKELFAQRGTAYMLAEGLPTDPRVDQLAEYLGFLSRRILREWFPKAEWSTTLLLDLLGLREAIPPARAEAQRSGTPTGWFYVAARYLQRHPLAPDELDERMQAIGARVLTFLTEQGLAPTSSDRFAQAFRDYARSVLTVDGRMLAALDQISGRFVREIQQYATRKATNKVQCSLCSSPYEARQQDKSEVLFKPQQYSNKTRLDTSTVVRGICPICALELMLRQVQQNLRAGTAQDEKPITLFLYPTYFFTAETAEVVHSFVARLRDLFLPDLLRHLEREGFTLDALARYEHFVAGDEEERRPWSVQRPAFSERDPASLFFFSLRPSKITDTDSWIIPALYALALPLLLDVKVVASASFVPIYGSGAEFRGTAILDAPHHFTSYLLDATELRVNDLLPALWRLLRLYQLHLDVFGEPKDQHWGLFNSVVKDVVSDELSVFSYYDRKQRKSKEDDQPKSTKAKRSPKAAEQPSASGRGIPPFIVDRYMAIANTFRSDRMSLIEHLVDGYAKFYRADYRHLDSAYTVLRPLGTAIDVTKTSSPETCETDLVLMIAGAINDEMDRIRNDAATSGGYDPVVYDRSLGTLAERLVLSMQYIETFARDFVERCFRAYCKGDRGILRERANRIRSAANFYYLSRYARSARQPHDNDTDGSASGTTKE
jgi:CRISPR-associated protein Csc3